jgi:glucan phosphorylase
MDYLSPHEPERCHTLIDRPLDGCDRFLVLADSADYLAYQQRIGSLWGDHEACTRAVIHKTRRHGPLLKGRGIQDRNLLPESASGNAIRKSARK